MSRLRSLVAAVVVVLCVVAACVAGAWWWTSQRAFVVADVGSVEPGVGVFSLPDATSEAPDVAAVVGGFADDPALGRLSAHVSDAVTGEVLWQKDADKLLVPASATKIFTAAAALSVLDSQSRLETRVVEESPGNLVIVGAGDVTLSDGSGDGFYTDAASVSELANKVSQSLGSTQVSSIRVDNSVRAGDLFNETWDRADVGGGNVTDLDAVMVNGGRINATQSDSPRSSTPGTDVASALAQKLGAPGAKVSISDQPAAAGARVVGSVQSAPLDVRLRDMLVNSDNLLAEAVGREVAAARGLPTTFEGAVKATLDVLSSAGVDVSTAVLRDNSGMSGDNRLSATMLDTVLVGEAFRPLLDALPVSSVEGTLAGRYGQGSGSENSAGYVRAKTGTLDGVNALAGTVMTVNGRPLTFAFLSNGSQPDAARPALDRLANALREAQ